jgi:hypothetical protein
VTTAIKDSLGAATELRQLLTGQRFGEIEVVAVGAEEFTDNDEKIVSFDVRLLPPKGATWDLEDIRKLRDTISTVLARIDEDIYAFVRFIVSTGK